MYEVNEAPVACTIPSTFGLCFMGSWYGAMGAWRGPTSPHCFVRHPPSLLDRLLLLPPPPCFRESLGFISTSAPVLFPRGRSLLRTINHTILLPASNLCTLSGCLGYLHQGEKQRRLLSDYGSYTVCSSCATVFHTGDGVMCALGCRSLIHPLKLDCKQ